MSLEDIPYGMILYRCTPEERKTEYSLAMTQLEMINKSRYSKKEKNLLINMLLDYLCQYERLYNKANKSKDFWSEKGSSEFN